MFISALAYKDWRGFGARAFREHLTSQVVGLLEATIEQMDADEREACTRFRAAAHGRLADIGPCQVHDRTEEDTL